MSSKHRLLERRLAERGGRVVQRHRPRRRRRRSPGRPAGSCRGPADAGAGHERLQREAAERHDQRRVEHLQLPPQDGAQAAISSGSGSRLPGGRHFTTLVMKTSSRCQPMEPMSSVEQAAGGAHERPALLILVLARVPRRRRRPRCPGSPPPARLGCGPRAGGSAVQARTSAAIASSAARRSSRRSRDPTGTASRPAPASRRVEHQLGDLDGVGGGALAQVVADAPRRRGRGRRAWRRPARTRPTKISSRPAASVASG